ncbi:MAG: hypothetical protein JNK05_25645 [Myxococcales bacterium]|nr:hypothetical protein [Myxococcales bacterium]
MWRSERSVATITVALALAVGACSSAPSALSRVIASHNALRDTRGAILGPVVEGSLQEGAQQSISLALETQCYTVSAYGGDGARAIALSISDDTGALVASSERTTDAPSVRYCPRRAGNHTATVRMVRGSGTFALGSWAIDRRAADRRSTSATPTDGTCRAPHRIALGASISDSTSGAPALHASECIPPDGRTAPELVYEVEVSRPTVLQASVHARWPAVLSLRSQCDEPSTELACAIRHDERSSELAALVGPGKYLLFVDGGDERDGDFTLDVRGAAPPVGALCANAPLLVPGVAVRGTTLGKFDRVQHACGRVCPAPDAVYRLEISERSRVRVSIANAPHLATISIFRGCAGRATDTVLCRATDRVGGGAEVDAMLDPGEYSVVVDGMDISVSGAFDLRADVLRVGDVRVAAPGDHCSNAFALPSTGAVDGDLFSAADDVTAPCGARSGAFDQVFYLDLTERSLVDLIVEGPGSGTTLFVVDACDGRAALACRSTSRESSELETVLSAGRHFVVVESSRPEELARFRLFSNVRSAAAVDRLCANPTILAHNAPVHGLARPGGALLSNCDDDANDASAVYRLVLDRRSTVTLSATTRRASRAGAPIAVSIRRDCADRHSELVCDSGAMSTTSVDARLDRGTYWVIVSTAVGNGATAPFTLRAVVDPDETGLLPTFGGG